MRAVAGRRRLIGRIVLWLAVAVTVLCAVLLIGVWRNDRAIETHRQTATAEVLEPGVLRSTITFVTPDGVTRNPRAGVLYPTNLLRGQHIEVEYDSRDPDLVRVAGRSVTVALIPVGSVLVITWALAGLTLWWSARTGRVTEPVRSKT